MSGHQEGRFQQEIELLSQQSSKNHVYPRPGFISLNQYLKSSVISRFRTNAPNITSTASEEDITTNFAVIHNIATGTPTIFGPSQTDIAQFSAYKAVQNATLLFLRGHASPQWLETVGEKYGVSPELYRRHLQFKAFASGDRDLYSSPSMPSSSARVFQFTISTICVRNVAGSPYEPENLQNARQLEEEALGRYFKQLRTRAQVADSLVLKCLLLSKQEYVLEQTITIEAEPPADAWRAVVWLDSGKDLSQSVEGPWSPRPGTRAWETYFFPVIVHQADGAPSRSRNNSKMPTRSMAYPTSSQTTHASNGPATEWKAAQNICLLPFQYGSHLDKDIVCQDALYALGDVFHFAASSELQFLNLPPQPHRARALFRRPAECRPTQRRLIAKSEMHQDATHVTCSTARRDRQYLGEPRFAGLAPRSRILQGAEKAAHLLLTDFKYLLQRAEALARECEYGMDTLANSSILEESRRSAENAMMVHKLTVIATIFIPLSFVCSVWGMNFRELGSGDKPLWMWFVTAGPVILISLLVYRSDTLLRLFRKSS